ncbi:MAG: four helix bundle protein [Ignavibacteriae bacterium]|nr:MAG: four helix bundle protein [Ignavibacteriota bacterium]
MKFNRFEEIEVWQISRAFAKDIYEITKNRHFTKDFDLKRQIRRCAVSIPSNIAEGYERKSNTEFIRFLYISKGSAGELRTQLYISKDLDYIEEKIFNELLCKSEETSRSLSGFIKYLEKSSRN